MSEIKATLTTLCGCQRVMYVDAARPELRIPLHLPVLVTTIDEAMAMQPIHIRSFELVDMRRSGPFGMDIEAVYREKAPIV